MRAGKYPLLALSFALFTSACGTSSHTSRADPTVSPTVSIPEHTTAPSDAPNTTSGKTTTTSSVAPVVLPVPISPPTDSRGAEPHIQLGTIEIPRIGLNAPLLEGIRLVTLDKGPAHWPGSAMPGGVGNVVVGGHRTSRGKPFRHIDDLIAGDEVIFTVEAGRFVYQVVSTEIVSPDKIDIVDQTPAKTATLFSCNPPGSTRERIIVHLELVEN